MSKKAASLALAAVALALSVSTAFAKDGARDSRRQAARSEWTYGAREPFTAAEKRAFQTPTGHEVNRP